ncbi:restriction endonuclease [Streptomyces sp. NPDC006551]|uniref:restriction endonuclease n=1 Tax=Streptomyces sp. NPDC006551 TaxID=3157178 RepID=UPI0033A3BC24
MAIGWDRFEKLMLAVAGRVLAIRGVRFRRYGVQGQAQHGIDLAGRDPEGQFVVVQCKDYQEFTAGQLRAAVRTFTSGDRPFGARHLIVATSASTERTQLADELARLQDEHRDLELDLWGPSRSTSSCALRLTS